jgi:hypothetical protein
MIGTIVDSYVNCRRGGMLRYAVHYRCDVQYVHDWPAADAADATAEHAASPSNPARGNRGDRIQYYTLLISLS